MKTNTQTLFTQADFDAFDRLLEQIEDLVKDKFAAALTPKERSDLGTINEQNKLFVNKTLDLHQADPSKSSPDVDWVEFKSDADVRRFMETRGERVGSLHYRMESTKILHDHDNFHDALTNYSYAQYKAKIGESGYAEIVAELKQFFPRNKKAVKDGEPNEPDS